MTVEKINLKEHFPMLPNDVELHFYNISYSREYAGKVHPAMIICPGGGYVMTSDREAEPIAFGYLAHGISCFILRYSVAPSTYPTAHTELAAAVAYVRAHAKELLVNPDAIGLTGFSAGGHLIGSYSAGLWHDGGFAEKLGVDVEMLRPNAMVPCYGLLLSSGEFTHDGCIHTFLGDNDTPEMRESIDTVKLIGENTPPAFLFHTAPDKVVPVENSLLVACALSAHKIPFAMRIYHECGHGIARANRMTNNEDNLPPAYISRWIDDCSDWFLRITGYRK
ncbi:MAG: alpha/beta hydrolase [Clostridia bacterium]|nr:alpha/beta hydrolase [Clostridia bacterium]